MIKLIIINPFDILIYMKHHGMPRRFYSSFFYKLNAVQYMKDNGIEIITIGNFVKDINLKYELRDYNTAEKYYENYSVNTEKDIQKYYHDAFNNFKDQLINTDNFDNSVLYCFTPMAYDNILDDKTFEIIEKKNIDVIIFHDDMHGYINVHANITTKDLRTTDKNKLKFTDKRLDRCKYILSHSKKVLEYVNCYVDKCIWYFSPLDDIIYTMGTPSNFFDRKKKILLTGSTSAYPLRLKISQEIQRKKQNICELYDFFYPNTSAYSIDNAKTNSLYSYYSLLYKYQAAIVGFAYQPIDFLIYKVFEVLACGTLLFCEENEELDKIGMKKYVHYVPVNHTNYENNEYVQKYLGTEEGKKIACEGHKFVRKFMDLTNCLDFYIDLIKTIKSKEIKIIKNFFEK